MLNPKKFSILVAVLALSLLSSYICSSIMIDRIEKGKIPENHTEFTFLNDEIICDKSPFNGHIHGYYYVAQIRNNTDDDISLSFFVHPIDENGNQMYKKGVDIDIPANDVKNVERRIDESQVDGIPTNYTIEIKKVSKEN